MVLERDMKKIYFFEPVFFLFFGAFHLHRVWALVDRQHYADFWIGLFREKGILYFFLMGTLACFCILGIAIFFRNRQKNYKWRWIYLIGGGYLLFDLTAIAVEVPFWERVILWMYDVSSPFWNVVWGGFIIMGAAVFSFGVYLLKAYKNKYIDW